MCTNGTNYIDPSSVINTSIFDSIRDMATCVFCTGVVINAKQCSKCENCFCKECLTKWKEKSNDCPFKCGELVISEPSRVIKNILNRISFRCPKNCKKEVNYEGLIKHVTNCNNRIINCPTCDSKVSEDKIQKQSYFEIKIENEILKAKISLVEKQLRLIERDKKLAELRDPNANRLNKINIKCDGVPDYYREDCANYVNNELKKNSINSGVNNSNSNSKSEMINIDKLIPPGGDINLGFILNHNKDKIKIDPVNISNINFEIHDTSVRFSYKFSCCSKYYDCIPCHNSTESHSNAKIVSIACYECLAMTNYIDESFCENCGNSFLKENIELIEEYKRNSIEDHVYNGAKEALLEDIFSNKKNNSDNKYVGEYGRNEWDKIQIPGEVQNNHSNHNISNDSNINNLFADEISKISRSSSKKSVISKPYKSKPKRGNGDGNYFNDF